MRLPVTTVEDVVDEMRRLSDKLAVLPATAEDLVELELACGTRLPDDYRQFLSLAGRTRELPRWTGGSSWFPELVQAQASLRQALTRRGCGDFALAIRFAWYEGQSFVMLGEEDDWSVYFMTSGSMEHRAGMDGFVDLLALLVADD